MSNSILINKQMLMSALLAFFSSDKGRVIGSSEDLLSKPEQMSVFFSILKNAHC